MLARRWLSSYPIARLALAAPALLLLAAPAVAQLRFAPLGKRHLPLANDSSTDVAPADLDGDGDLDLVVSNDIYISRDQNRIYVNDGSGVFVDETGSRMPSNGDASSAIGVGDFDGDGDLDLVFANAAKPKSMYLNDGAGRFADASARLPRINRLTTSVAVGDVDSDGDLDLVFGNTWDPPAYIATSSAQNELYLNDGDAYFVDATARLPADSDFTNAVVLADVDGDDDLDLIAGNADDDPTLFPSSRTKLYLNDGTGFFANTSGRIPSGNHGTRTIAAGDVDGDGDVDLVLGNHSRFFAPEPSLLYLNDGAGTFSNATGTRFPQDTPTRATTDVRLVDLSGDGKLDVLLGTYQAVNQLFVNYGSGTFFDGSSRLPQRMHDTFGVVAGDLDADGDADIVGVNYFEQDYLQFNDGTGRFRDAVVARFPSVGATYSVAAGDVEGDGDVDIVFGGINNPKALLLNDGDGGFVDASSNLPPGTSYVWDIAIGDVDGDADADLVFADLYSGGNKLFTNDGHAVFANQTASLLPPSLGSTYALALGDVDDDGDRDLVLGNGNVQDQLFLNAGNGSFVDATAGRMPNDADSTYGLALGDVDADGDADLLVGNVYIPFGDQDRLYTNDGSGFFTDATTQLPAILDSTNDFALGDLDADGDLDVVLGNEGYSQEGQDRLYLNDGAGNFTDATTGRMPFDDDNTWFLTLVDLDEDGDRDLLRGVFSSPGDSIYENAGGGTFTDVTASTIGIASAGVPTTAADVDRDGDVDLILGTGLWLNLARQLDSPLLVRIGQTFRLDLYARGTTPAPWAQVVVSSTAWSPQAGAVALGPGGAVASGLVRIPQPAGVGSISFPVPDDPSLAGAAVRARAYFLDPLAGTRVRSNRTTDVIVK